MPVLNTEPDSNGITDVPGFRTGAIACDIRNKGNERLDLALIVSDSGASCAGVFTTNAIQAAPVRLSHEVLARQSQARAIVVNSGNANACTGKQGMRDALDMQGACARALGIESSEVLVCSTGRIGEYLPMERVRKGIAELAPAVSSDSKSGLAAADAILTSDTRRKVVTIRFETGRGKTITIAGMAKGAGMIQPNMATMLAFLATDAQLEKTFLQECLRTAVRGSFNAITVDGDMSTNDTVLLLANGASGVAIEADTEDAALFQEALNEACQVLAAKMVGDGEKISHVVELLVDGAATSEDAEAVARAIGNSLLVKTSWFGGDPNWGRLLDAAGYSGARMEEEHIELYYSEDRDAEAVPVFVHGEAHPDNKPRWREIVSRKAFTIRLHLNQGEHAFRLLSTDLTEGYVNFNKSE